MASKGLTNRQFCASVQRTSSRRDMPPRVFCKKSPQAIENKQWECGEERKERQRVCNSMTRQGLRLRRDSPWMNPEVLRGILEGYTPVATGGMRNLLRTGGILAPRGADDGTGSWLRENTRGCGGRKGRNGATVSRTLNIDYRIRNYLSSEK